MPKTSSIRSAVLVELRLVTDIHRPIASTASRGKNAPQQCYLLQPNALYPYVDHVRRRDLEALTSNGKLHKR